MVARSLVSALFGLAIGLVFFFQLSMILDRPNVADHQPGLPVGAVWGPAALAATTIVLVRSRSVGQSVCRGLLLCACQWSLWAPIVVSWAFRRHLTHENQSLAAWIGALGAGLLIGLGAAIVGGGFWLTCYGFARRLVARRRDSQTRVST